MIKLIFISVQQTNQQFNITIIKKNPIVEPVDDSTAAEDAMRLPGTSEVDAATSHTPFEDYHAAVSNTKYETSDSELSKVNYLCLVNFP